MYDLVIIGAGLSGINAAIKAAEIGLKKVLVVDYRDQIGGFTSPYFSSPLFSRELALREKAVKLPYEIWTKSTVVGLFPGENDEPHQLFIQKANSTESVESKKILIASGSLEKPREANRIPGTRPAGVMTPYLAMELLKRSELPGKKILSVGDSRMHGVVNERLKEAGCLVDSVSAEDIETLTVHGKARVTGATYKTKDSSETTSWEGDTIIYSHGRIPCTFFLKGTPVERDRHYTVIVNEKGETNIPRIFAVGSCTILGDNNHLNSLDLAENKLDGLWKGV